VDSKQPKPGEGVQQAGGHGIAAGAIIPEPPDVQAEEALEEDPPWNTLVASETPAEIVLSWKQEEGGGGLPYGEFADAGATGGPYNKVKHGGSPNEGGTGPCRSGGKIVNGKCTTGKPKENGDFCEAVAVATIAPAIWTPAGWVALATAEAMCKIAKATHQ
jgi:hypothetical protein